MPKLLYLLRTAECSNNPLLAAFDDKLKSGLSDILNVELSDAQWLQASLPVRHGGLGIRTAQMLARTFSLFGVSCIYAQPSVVHPATVCEVRGR